MTTFALVGAGPGLGMATARRFGTAGHNIALISRSTKHTSGAPEAADPRAGDLAHYAPWQNLALFRRAGETSPGLVILGHLSDSKDIDRLATADRVTIEAPA